MLIHHPAIKSIHTREDFTLQGRLYKTLVVETDIPLPKKWNYADTSLEFAELINYLSSIKNKKLCDFSKLEIKPYRPSMTSHQTPSDTIDQKKSA